jgi:hypothetical protein
LLIPHKVKNKGKYISFHYLRGWKARKIRKVQEISPQIPIEQNRCAMACQGCGAVLFLLKKQWNYFT